MMRTLSLFSGIGGFELAATALNCFNVEQFVEIDEDAHHVLRQHYLHIPIHSDIRIFSATPGQYDCIWGGFPSTGTSNAGQPFQQNITISHYGAKSKTKGRIRAKYVFAKTVMPGQAYIALKQVQHLAKAFGIID